MTGAAAHPPAEVVAGLDVGTTATKVLAFGLGSSWRYTVQAIPPEAPAGEAWARAWARA